MEQWSGPKLEKDNVEAVCYHPAYLTYMHIYYAKCWADEAQAGTKIARKNINNLRYADDTTLMAESEEKLKRLEESERGEWKSWLKTQRSEN